VKETQPPPPLHCRVLQESSDQAGQGKLGAGCPEKVQGGPGAREGGRNVHVVGG